MPKAEQLNEDQEYEALKNEDYNKGKTKKKRLDFL